MTLDLQGKKYKLVAKRGNTGKSWIFGNLATNKWGNPNLSFKKTPELRALLEAGGEWLNFAIYEDEPKPEKQGQLHQERSGGFDGAPPF